MEEKIKVIKKQAEKLLDEIGISATVSVEENGEGFNVQLDTQENALLIGKHGNTLTSFEFILTLIVAKKLGEYYRLTVEVGGYRQEREDYLRDLATRLKEEVLSSGFEKSIRGLKPWERRLVHMHFAEDSEVMTESSGDDRDRVLVIKKK